MQPLTRRSVLGLGAAGLATTTVWAIDRGVRDGAAQPPVRLDAGVASGRALPEIQHDVDAVIAPAVTRDGVAFRFGPAYTLFLTAALTRTPTLADQRRLEQALAGLEGRWPFSQAGVLSAVAYGQAYLDRLNPAVVTDHLPRLAADTTRAAFEEAVPGPTDVTAGGAIRKKTLNVPVAIETNDVLLTLRGDRLDDVIAAGDWLLGVAPLPGGSGRSGLHGLLRPTSSRLIFNLAGMPRRLATAATFDYFDRVHPQSPLWMGFSDHQVGASASAAGTTFAGAGLTTARSGDYLADASVVHLSHVLLDLEQYYLPDPDHLQDDEGSYTKRVQYMFRGSHPPAAGNADQFTDGGGPAYLLNEFRGTGDAELGARGVGVPDRLPRLGHVAALQRASRSAQGTPLHVRVDGAGFDAIDTPDGAKAPKLHFAMYVPTAETFAGIRRAGASLDLVRRHGVRERDNGIERFLTATRRQNFLSPPRSHRAFPLLEFS